MSELQKKAVTSTNQRWQLLATVSMITLMGSVCGSNSSNAADDVDRPSVWIEIGGQLSRLSNVQESFSPALMADRPSNLFPSEPFEKQSLYSFDETGRIAIQPQNSDWIFSASLRYGRSNVNRHAYQQTHPKSFVKYHSPSSSLVDIPSGARFSKTRVQNSEQHAVLDFQVGKDVGLGVLGGNATSVFNFGVRFAQFIEKSDITLKSDPDWRFQYKYLGTVKLLPILSGGYFHTNRASITAARSFHGVGPSMSWSASTPVVGGRSAGELTVDWGLNAAVLFGRQKARVHHQATGLLHSGFGGTPYELFKLTYAPPPANKTRSRSITVPNVGGFAGLSYRIESVKVSAGYRADFFFGAMDGGIDTARSYDRGFFGPYATISIGLGG